MVPSSGTQSAMSTCLEKHTHRKLALAGPRPAERCHSLSTYCLGPSQQWEEWLRFTDGGTGARRTQVRDCRPEGLTWDWRPHLPASVLTVTTAGNLLNCLWVFGPQFFHPQVQFSSVAQSCPTVCDPMDCSMPGLPVHHQLLEPTQTHVH